MEATNKFYDFNKSLERIDEILNADNKQYEEKKSIPSRDTLTFTNGFYVDCTALFVVIIIACYAISRMLLVYR